jgi:hypothetical protein
VAQYRKRPVVVEAIQWQGDEDGADALAAWANMFGTHVWHVGVGENHDLRRDEELHAVQLPQSAGGTTYVANEDAPAFIVIDTLEGRMRADVGHFVIRGVKDEFYSCEEEIFNLTYELVELPEGDV